MEKIYRKELLAKPPKVVIYSNVDENTINQKQFEQNIFPWHEVMIKCYNQIENINSFYLSKYTQKEMKKCFINILMKKNFEFVL